MKNDKKNKFKVAVAGSYETDTGQKTSTLIEQIENVSSTDLISFFNHSIDEAKKVLQKAGVLNIFSADNKKGEDSVKIFTDDLELFCTSEEYDLVIVSEINTEKATEIIYNCLQKGKNVINLNAVSEITLGPLFKKTAISNNTIYSMGAGDEPAAILQMVEFCHKLGLDVISAGKGKNNPLNIYSNPDNFQKKSEEMGVSPQSIASFVDGTKTMLEMAILSNATGYPIDIEGMHGPKANIGQLPEIFCSKEDGGILNTVPSIDYAVGDVAPGVFVVFSTNQKSILEELNYLKMGKGPYYVIYKPYHLGNIESLFSIYDVLGEKRPTLVMKDSFITYVVGRTKRHLRKGEKLDSSGGYTYSGCAIGFQDAIDNNYVPLGLLENSTVSNEIKKGQKISFNDITLDTSSIRYDLWKKQEEILK